MFLFELIIAIGASALGIGLFFFGAKKSNESGILSTYVPVDTIKSIPIEIPVIVTGTISGDNATISPITKKPCVYFKLIVEKQVEDKNTNGTTTVSWKQVGNPEESFEQFYIADKSGKIMVKPDSAEVNGTNKYESFLTPGTIQNNPDAGGIEKIALGIMQAGANLTRSQERVTEYALFVGTSINIFGILSQEGETQFFQNTKQYPLIITTKSKSQLVSSEKLLAYVMFGGGAIALAGGIYFALRLFHIVN